MGSTRLFGAVVPEEVANRRRVERVAGESKFSAPCLHSISCYLSGLSLILQQHASLLSPLYLHSQIV